MKIQTLFFLAAGILAACGHSSNSTRKSANPSADDQAKDPEDKSNAETDKDASTGDEKTTAPKTMPGSAEELKAPDLSLLKGISRTDLSEVDVAPIAVDESGNYLTSITSVQASDGISLVLYASMSDKIDYLKIDTALRPVKSIKINLSTGSGERFAEQMSAAVSPNSIGLVTTKPDYQNSKESFIFRRVEIDEHGKISFKDVNLATEKVSGDKNHTIYASTNTSVKWLEGFYLVTTSITDGRDKTNNKTSIYLVSESGDLLQTLTAPNSNGTTCVPGDVKATANSIAGLLACTTPSPLSDKLLDQVYTIQKSGKYETKIRTLQQGKDAESGFPFNFNESALASDGKSYSVVYSEELPSAPSSFKVYLENFDTSNEFRQRVVVPTTPDPRGDLLSLINTGMQFGLVRLTTVGHQLEILDDLGSILATQDFPSATGFYGVDVGKDGEIFAMIDDAKGDLFLEKYHLGASPALSEVPVGPVVNAPSGPVLGRAYWDNEKLHVLTVEQVSDGKTRQTYFFAVTPKG